MTRKPPYKHPVSSYTRRDGKRIDDYERGKGAKPKQSTARPQKRKTNASGYGVTLILSKAKEFYPVTGDSFSEASKAGLKHLQAGEIPMKVRVKIR